MVVRSDLDPVLSAGIEHARLAGEWFTRQFVAEVQGEVGDLESPLEAIFYAWWRAVRLRHVLGTGELNVDIFPQRVVTLSTASYRLDFEVSLYVPEGDISPLFPHIGVELDGHEFHERTKEQVQLRDRRDRDLQVAGWTIFHFSGSELVRNPLLCVEQVYDFAEGKYWDAWGAARHGRRA